MQRERVREKKIPLAEKKCYMSKRLVYVSRSELIEETCVKMCMCPDQGLYSMYTTVEQTTCVCVQIRASIDQASCVCVQIRAPSV